MENIKYVNLCIDYEEKVKTHCDMITIQNSDYCDGLKTLLNDCYNFKEQKLKQVTTQNQHDN
jgi:hypothetical protein|tara:strand:+ start:219 stop:404 length:186 start_codon:yes stop_codon:yes gene_type:complete